jgi:hypothetical protein
LPFVTQSGTAPPTVAAASVTTAAAPGAADVVPFAATFESAAPAESAAPSGGSVPDAVGGQVANAGAAVADAPDLPGGNAALAAADVAAELLLGGRPAAAVLPQRQGSSGPVIAGLTDEGPDQAAIEPVPQTDDDTLNFMVGLNYTPLARRPSRPAAAGPRGNAPRAPLPPHAGRVPPGRNEGRELSLPERLAADAHLGLTLAAAGTAAGAYCLAAWFASRNPPPRREPMLESHL